MCGTEQGHPMSPELFKCYINDLSQELNDLDNIAVPTLDGLKVSHLLWADDLILMALNRSDLQALLNILLQHCLNWGLSVNISKTAVMVFNKTGRLLKDSHGLMYGDQPLPSVREYCYLGIVFTLNGSLITAQQRLRQKGLRSYFSIKSMIDVRMLKKTTIFKLFDALIKPVVAYGCAVWFSETWIVRNIAEHRTGERLSVIAKDPLERLHLSFLKWTIGVSRKTSNAAVWGDSGRDPLAIDLSKQVFNYLQRLEAMDANNCNNLVTYAFREQKALNLTWYSRLSEFLRVLQSHSATVLNYPSKIRTQFKKMFDDIWNTDRSTNKKLQFYNSIKSSFEAEEYISIHMDREDQKRLAQFRMSSHKYRIETGRYGHDRDSVLSRICPNCSSDDKDILFMLNESPFFEPIVENEQHILNKCQFYQDIRLKLKKAIKDLLNTNDGLSKVFESSVLVRDLAKYLRRCHNLRFPKKKLTEDNGKKKRGL